MKFLKMIVYFAALTAVSLTARQGSGSEPAPLVVSVPTKELMKQFLTELTALKVYFVSEEKFVDPKNNAVILDHLKQFSRLAKTAVHDPVLNQENYKFSRYVMQEEIVEIERMFRLGNKTYARWQLASTAGVCMSCHTQMPKVSQTFSEFSNSKIFSSDFDRADFLFAIGGFDKAFDLYDKMILGYPKNNLSAEQVETAVERQLAYYSRLKRDPKAAIVKMKEYLKNTELSEYTQKNISAWISQFEIWKKEPVLDPKTSTDSEIVRYAKNNIEAKWTDSMLKARDPSIVMYLRVSGVLYEFLQSHPNATSTPEVLYWLSVCDRSLSTNFFYSFADLYLRECIIRYADTQIAKRCYREFETQTVLGYSGSGGSNLPPEVKQDLKRLSNLVNKVKVERHEP